MTDTPDPNELYIGATITEDSVFPASITAYSLNTAVLNSDGSRYVIANEYIRVADWLTQYRAQVLERWPNNQQILADQPTNIGFYIGYAAHTATRDVVSRDPVNQMPYVVHLREHLATAAHEWVENPLHDIVQHETNAGHYNPATNVLSTADRRKFELANHNIRRLIGVMWGKVNVLAGLSNPGLNENALRAVWNQVVQVCDFCAGRGWKRHILRHMNVTEWEKRYAVAATSIFFLDYDDAGNLEPGRNVEVNEADQTAALPWFVDALKYHESTTGKEASIHEAGITRTIGDILAGGTD